MSGKHPVVGLATPLLEALGFRKRAGESYTIQLTPAILGMVMLSRSRGLHKGDSEWMPIIGVHFQEVEKLVAECRGNRARAYLPFTVREALGYLQPSATWKGWTFGPEPSPDVATDMVKQIEAYGVPFMRSFQSLADLSRKLDERPDVEYELAYRRPVAAFLNGDLERALELLTISLQRLGNRSDPAEVVFRTFAGNLRTRILASPVRSG
jgi:hypothetical protein